MQKYAKSILSKFKNQPDIKKKSMKNSFTERIRNNIEAFAEKFIEIYYWLSGKLEKERQSSGSLTEEFSIAEEFMEDVNVIEFLKGRNWAAEANGYKMKVNYSHYPTDENEIGEVTLYCRGKRIESAKLMNDKERRVIYWVFNKTNKR